MTQCKLGTLDWAEGANLHWQLESNSSYFTNLDHFLPNFDLFQVSFKLMPESVPMHRTRWKLDKVLASIWMGVVPRHLVIVMSTAPRRFNSWKRALYDNIYYALCIEQFSDQASERSFNRRTRAENSWFESWHLPVQVKSALHYVQLTPLAAANDVHDTLLKCI